MPYLVEHDDDVSFAQWEVIWMARLEVVGGLRVDLGAHGAQQRPL